MNDENELPGSDVNCVHIRLEGRVQGVCFRDFAVRLARQMNVDGWVRNRRDGALELIAVASPAVLEEFVRQCVHVGPPGARIDSFELFTADPPEAKGFIRLPTI